MLRNGDPKDCLDVGSTEIATQIAQIVELLMPELSNWKIVSGILQDCLGLLCLNKVPQVQVVELLGSELSNAWIHSVHTLGFALRVS